MILHSYPLPFDELIDACEMLGLDLALSLILVFVSSVFTSVQKGSYFEGRRVLIVAGNFTLDGERLNIAQFDVHSGM